jgi:hypothetical protein
MFLDFLKLQGMIEDPKRYATQKRVISSAEYLVDYLAEVPVHVIPCIAAHTEG